MNIRFSRAQLLAFLFLILFIFSFNVLRFGTLDEVRFILHDVAARPENAADLRAQYDNMTAYFSGNADTYTYYFMSSPIDIKLSEISMMYPDGDIEKVVDKYAFRFYYSDLIYGLTGYIFSRNASTFFSLVTFISYILSILFQLKIDVGSRTNARQNKIKTIGITLAAASVCAFALLILLLLLIGQIFHESIAASDFGNVWNTVEVSVISALIQNTLFGIGWMILTIWSIIRLARRPRVAEQEK